MSIEKIRELRAERATLIKQAQAMRSEAGDELTTEQRAEWEAKMDAADQIEGRYTQMEQDEERARAAAESILEAQEVMDATREFGGKRESAEQRKVEYGEAFRTYLLTGNDAELRTLGGQTKGTTTAGGYTVPTNFQAELIQSMLLYGGLREAARTIQTATGASLQWPVSDDTGNKAKIFTDSMETKVIRLLPALPQ